MILLAVVLTVAVAAQELVPVPEPSLDGAEAGFRARIEAAQAALDDLAETAPDADRAAAFGELGSLYLLTELRAPAEAALLNAHHLDPTEPRWPYFLGLVRLDLGDLDGALASLRSALLLRPGALFVQLRLADALRQAGLVEEAARRFEEVLAKSDGTGEAAFARFGLARIAVEQGRFQAAVEFLEAVRAAVPEATLVRRVLGQAYREVGRVDEARLEMQAGGDEPVPLPDAWVDELHTIDTGAYLAKAVAARVRGDLAEAARWFRRAVAADTASGDALRGLAEVLFAAGDRDGALEAMERAVEVEPTRADLQAHFGELLVLAGRPGDAIPTYRRAVELNPQAPKAQLGLGRALAMTGHHEEALGHYDRAIELEPDDVEARALKARALSRLGRHADAAGELAAAVSVDPGNARVRLAHVDALARAGDTVGVRKSLEAGIASSDDPRLVATLIQVLLGDPDPERRDPDRAVALGVEQLRKEPSVANAVLVAGALFASGRVAEAVDLQQRALAEARSGGASEAETSAMARVLEVYRSRLEAGDAP